MGGYSGLAGWPHCTHMALRGRPQDQSQRETEADSQGETADSEDGGRGYGEYLFWFLEAALFSPRASKGTQCPADMILAQADFRPPEL